MDTGASTSVCVQAIQTVSGFLSLGDSLLGHALKELKLRYTEGKKVGEEIFIIPKESVSDLKQLNLLLTSLAWCGRDKMSQGGEVACVAGVCKWSSQGGSHHSARTLLQIYRRRPERNCLLLSNQASNT